MVEERAKADEKTRQLERAMQDEKTIFKERVKKVRARRQHEQLSRLVSDDALHRVGDHPDPLGDAVSWTINARVPWADQPHGLSAETARVKKQEAEIEKHNKRFGRPVSDLRQALADHQWHPTSIAHTIARKHRVQFWSLLDRAGVAISDGSGWMCLPDAGTPERAPDEGGDGVA